MRARELKLIALDAVVARPESRPMRARELKLHAHEAHTRRPVAPHAGA